LGGLIQGGKKMKKILTLILALASFGFVGSMNDTKAKTLLEASLKFESKLGGSAIDAATTIVTGAIGMTLAMAIAPKRARAARMAHVIARRIKSVTRHTAEVKRC